MIPGDYWQDAASLAQIVWVDLLLGADNAIAIAMICRGLPAREMRKAVFMGAGIAVVLRFMLAGLAQGLFATPYLRLLGAWSIFVVALNAADDEFGDEAGELKEAPAASEGKLVRTMLTIVAVDAVLSLDNVVAIAAISRGGFWLLAFGVLFSIPVLAYGALVMAVVVERFRLLTAVGCGLLGWIAADLALTDVAVSRFVAEQAPALAWVGPALTALLVFARAYAQQTLSSQAPSPSARSAVSPSR